MHDVQHGSCSVIPEYKRGHIRNGRSIANLGGPWRCRCLRGRATACCSSLRKMSIRSIQLIHSSNFSPGQHTTIHLLNAWMRVKRRSHCFLQNCSATDRKQASHLSKIPNKNSARHAPTMAAVLSGTHPWNHRISPFVKWR